MTKIKSPKKEIPVPVPPARSKATEDLLKELEERRKRRDAQSNAR